MILLTGGSASVHAGIPPPHPSGSRPPRSRLPLGADTPGADTPLSRHPQSRHPSQEQTPTPQSRHPLEQTPHSPEQTPPRSRLPWSKHPPWEQTTPQHRACSEIRSTCGQYASYWNAILLELISFWKLIELDHFTTQIRVFFLRLKPI